MLSFCNAELRPGFEIVAEVLDLEKAIARADFVITGEGSLDGQTLEGKTPAGVATVARRLGRPVLAFGGRLDPDFRAGLNAQFDEVIALSEAEPDLPVAELIARAAELLRRHAARVSARVAATAAR